ncbi:MAG: hypothetical protein AAFQ98_23015 [Bacteroidota bacterium]
MKNNSNTSLLKHPKAWIYVVASLALLSLIWPPVGAFFILPVAFIPLLLLQDTWQQQGASPWRYRFTVLGVALAWNTLAGFWILVTQPTAALITYITYAFLVTLPFSLYDLAKRKMGLRWGLILWIASYGVYEWFAQNWSLAYPLFSLSTPMGSAPYLIQWIEYTGWLGATLWILGLNAVGLVFLSQRRGGNRLSSPQRIALLLLVIAPLLFSLIRYFSYTPSTKTIEVLCM